MTEEIARLSNRHLFTMWTMILTVGVILSLIGLQYNYNEDAKRVKEAEIAQSIAFCHALSDNNQAVRDSLSLSGAPVEITDDMTPALKESIRIANERRKGYQLISDNVFPLPECSDGYKAKSRQEELNKLLNNASNGETTTTTIPGG